MKKIILTSIALLILTITSGCMKYSYQIDIDEDENVTYSETQAINVKLLDRYTEYNPEELQEHINTVAEFIRNSGYDVREYKREGYKGLTKSYKYKFEYFTKNKIAPCFSFDGNSPISVVSYFGGRKIYNLNMTFYMDPAEEFQYDYISNFLFTSQDIDKLSLKPEETDVLDKEEISSNNKQEVTNNESFTERLEQLVEDNDELLPELSLVVKVPGIVLKHNATKVINPNVYQWNFTPNEPSLISIEYETRDSALLGIIISMALLIVLLLVLIYKSKE